MATTMTPTENRSWPAPAIRRPPRRPAAARPGWSARCSARRSILSTSPQLAHVWIRAWRPMPHFGQITASSWPQVEQTVVPLG